MTSRRLLANLTRRLRRPGAARRKTVFLTSLPMF